MNQVYQTNLIVVRSLFSGLRRRLLHIRTGSVWIEKLSSFLFLFAPNAGNVFAVGRLQIVAVRHRHDRVAVDDDARRSRRFPRRFRRFNNFFHLLGRRPAFGVVVVDNVVVVFGLFWSCANIVFFRFVAQLALRAVDDAVVFSVELNQNFFLVRLTRKSAHLVLVAETVRQKLRMSTWNKEGENLPKY